MMTFNEGIWPSLWIGGRAGRRPSKCSRQRERHTQRPPGSFQELPGHCTAGSDGKSSARQHCRAQGQRPAPRRKALPPSYLLYLAHAHSPPRSQLRDSFSGSLSAPCRLSEACVLSPNKKKHLKLRNKGGKVALSLVAVLWHCLKRPTEGLVHSMGNILEFDFAL